MWLNTLVEANRSWIFEVTWNLVMVGSLPSDWEVIRSKRLQDLRGKRRKDRTVKSLRIIFNCALPRKSKCGVRARTPQTRLAADKSHTTWTLTLPITQIKLPIIQGNFSLRELVWITIVYI